jgi:Ca-activated chloride channel family protein
MDPVKNGRITVAARPITITKINPALSFVETAKAGESIAVTWEGPDYERDFISVGEVGQDSYISYTYSTEGSPLLLQMPAEHGNYEVRYQLRQDSVIILREPVAITPLKVQLVANPIATIGEDSIVGWDGPDYQNDYIAIAKVGDDGYETYSKTENDNPLSIRVLDEPGEHELRYVLRQDRLVIYSQPLTISE